MRGNPRRPFPERLQLHAVDRGARPETDKFCQTGFSLLARQRQKSTTVEEDWQGTYVVLDELLISSIGFVEERGAGFGAVDLSAFDEYEDIMPRQFVTMHLDVPHQLCPRS